MNTASEIDVIQRRQRSANFVVKPIVLWALLAVSGVYAFWTGRAPVGVRFGDNIHYAYSYKRLVKQPDLVSAYFRYKEDTGGFEPGTFLIFDLCAPFMDYYYCILIMNAVLLAGFGGLLYWKHSTGGVILFAIACFTDFYLYRLLGELHRLKFALLLSAIGLIGCRGKVSCYLWMVSAAIFHVQALAVFVAKVAYDVIMDVLRGKATVYTYISAGGIVVSLIAFAIAFREELEYHLRYNNEQSSKALIFLIPLGFAMTYFFYLCIIGATRNEMYNVAVTGFVITLISVGVGKARVFMFLYEMTLYREFWKIRKGKVLALLLVIALVAYNAVRTYAWLDWVQNGGEALFDF
jgi:hypothetical protein